MKNWYKKAKSDTARIPENWDIVEKGPDGGLYVGWDLWAGANDWETGVTIMAAAFGRDDGPGQTRVWVEVNNDQFQKGNDNDQPEETLEKVQEWGDKAVSTWLKEFKRIDKEREDSGVYENIPKVSFIAALDSSDMRPFIKKWGVDTLEWNAGNNTKEKNKNREQLKKERG